MDNKFLSVPQGIGDGIARGEGLLGAGAGAVGVPLSAAIFAALSGSGIGAGLGALTAPKGEKDKGAVRGLIRGSGFDSGAVPGALIPIPGVSQALSIGGGVGGQFIARNALDKELPYKKTEKKSTIQGLIASGVNRTSHKSESDKRRASLRGSGYGVPVGAGALAGAGVGGGLTALLAAALTPSTVSGTGGYLGDRINPAPTIIAGGLGALAGGIGGGIYAKRKLNKVFDEYLPYSDEKQASWAFRLGQQFAR